MTKKADTASEIWRKARLCVLLVRVSAWKPLLTILLSNCSKTVSGVGGFTGAICPSQRLRDGTVVVVRLRPEGDNGGLRCGIPGKSGAQDLVRDVAR